MQQLSKNIVKTPLLPIWRVILNRLFGQFVYVFFLFLIAELKFGCAGKQKNEKRITVYILSIVNTPVEILFRLLFSDTLTTKVS